MEVLKRASDLRPIAMCTECGTARAKYVACKRGTDGVGFDGLRCESCMDLVHSGYFVVELTLKGVRHFSGATNRRCFLRELRQACGLPAEGRIDPRKAMLALSAEPRLL